MQSDTTAQTTKVDWSQHKFATPKKDLALIEQMETFKKGKSYANYMQFVADLQQSVTSKKISETPADPKFENIVKMLEDLERWIAEIPPIQQPMRFGNKSFKTWHDRLKDNVDEYLAKILPEEVRGATTELRVYILESFGSNERLDYGTGHEMSFALFLYCLRELGLYGKEDYEKMVRNVFYRYIKLMRVIQLTYMLEPAGSHGVWGLDDHHFLPFLLGSAELINSEEIKTPEYIHQEKLLEEYSEEYMYLNCIQFIKKVKKGVPFHESSPILNDISGAASWQKVANGMIKMYQAEVLQKFPVAKHIHFGTIFPFN